MGYKTPLVCKEVYLPRPSSRMTFDQYKKNYGIDLIELFNLKIEDGSFSYSFPPLTKLFYVNTQKKVVLLQYSVESSNDDYPYFLSFSPFRDDDINPDGTSDTFSFVRDSSTISLENIYVQGI